MLVAQVSNKPTQRTPIEWITWLCPCLKTNTKLRTLSANHKYDKRTTLMDFTTKKSDRRDDCEAEPRAPRTWAMVSINRYEAEWNKRYSVAPKRYTTWRLQRVTNRLEQEAPVHQGGSGQVRFYTYRTTLANLCEAMVVYVTTAKEHPDSVNIPLPQRNTLKTKISFQQRNLLGK